MTVKTDQQNETISAAEFAALSEEEKTLYVPIDEISKEKLGQYIGKARDDEKHHIMSADEAPFTPRSGYQKHVRLAVKRDKGIKTAVKKLTREDTISAEEFASLSENEKALYVPIEELSKEKLGQYVDKAHSDALDAAHGFKKEPHFLKSVNRYKGVKMAVKKLTKEETDSASSLHPAAKSVDDPKSKLEYMTRVIGAMNAACSDELEKWYDASIATVGHEADGVGDVSAKNQSSVDAKPSDAVGSDRAKLKMPMPKLGDTGDQYEDEPSKRSHPGSMPMPKIDAREDIENLFAGETLSEEFMADAVTLFETAVTARVMLETQRVTEEIEAAYAAETEEFAEAMIDRLDSYLDYAVDSWMEENQLAVESTLRTELSTELVEALTGVLRDHYVAVPDGATDALEAMAERVTELEGKLNEAVSELVQTRRDDREAVRQDVIEAASEGLTLLSKEKLKTLAEQLEFDGDEESFAARVLLVREKFVDAKPAPKGTGIESEGLHEDVSETERKRVTDPTMRAYADAIGAIVTRGE